MSETIEQVDKVSGRIVWIDCEMTGLDIKSDALVEIAAIVTDADLNPLDGGCSFVIKPPATALAAMGDFVRKMHTDSGLINEFESGMTLQDTQEQLMAYLKTHIPEPRKAPLAGNSINMDRQFIARDLPAVDAYLHYRIIDVSSIKELARRWFPRAYFAAPKKSGNHRALGDIQDSIQELAYYRAAIMSPAPAHRTGGGSGSLKGTAAFRRKAPTRRRPRTASTRRRVIDGTPGSGRRRLRNGSWRGTRQSTPALYTGMLPIRFAGLTGGGGVLTMQCPVEPQWPGGA